MEDRLTLVTRLCDSRSGENSAISLCSISSELCRPSVVARLAASCSVAASQPSITCSSKSPTCARAAPASASGNASRSRFASATFAMKRGVAISAISVAVATSAVAVPAVAVPTVTGSAVAGSLRLA